MAVDTASRKIVVRCSVVLAVLATSVAMARGEQPGVVGREFIYERAPYPECHASTLIHTPAGLVAAWFGGTAEKNPDVGIWVARQVTSAGKTHWTLGVEAANGVQEGGKRYPCWNPVLFQPKGEALSLYYKVGPSPSSWWGMKMTSTDDGKAWSKSERLPEGVLGPIKNKPVQLADGTILAGSSTEHDGWRVHLERSTDGGKSFAIIGPINDGKEFGAIQPTILPWGERVQILCRSQQRKIVESWSSDSGRTWSKLAATQLPNPNSGIDAVKLADGRALLVYNHTPTTSGAKGREMLNVAVSKDGKAWQAAIVLEDEKRGEFSYPAVIQAPDGRVHVTYTWNRKKVRHVTIDPAKLELKEFREGAWPL
jgi:predicted neuraminidase